MDTTLPTEEDGLLPRVVGAAVPGIKIDPSSTLCRPMPSTRTVGLGSEGRRRPDIMAIVPAGRRVMATFISRLSLAMPALTSTSSSICITAIRTTTPPSCRWRRSAAPSSGTRAVPMSPVQSEDIVVATSGPCRRHRLHLSGLHLPRRCRATPLQMPRTMRIHLSTIHLTLISSISLAIRHLLAATGTVFPLPARTRRPNSFSSLFPSASVVRQMLLRRLPSRYWAYHLRMMGEEVR